MTVLAAIADWSVFAFALLLLAAQMLAHEAGYWFGWHRGARRRGARRRCRYRRRRHARPVGVRSGADTVVRQHPLQRACQGTLAEANAIGTAWLRAEAIGHVRGPEIAKLLEEYAQVRRDFVSERRDRSEIDEFNQRTNALQSKIWGHMAAIVREQPNTVSTSLMAALNDAFDQATAERFAYYLRFRHRYFGC